MAKLSISKVKVAKAVAALILVCLCFAFMNGFALASAPLDGWSHRQKITAQDLLQSTYSNYTLVRLNYGYYGLAKMGYEPATEINDQKVAVLNGERFIFINTGWGGGAGEGTPIKVYSADQQYTPLNLLAQTYETYSDFYVTTVPQLWNDTIIVHGNTGGRGHNAFIGFYNIATRNFELRDLASYYYGHYLTQVYYIEKLNLFSLRFLSLDNMAITDSQFMCTPSNLGNPQYWESKPITGGNMTYVLHENMFAYNSADGYGYLTRWSSDFGSETIRYNINTGEGTQIFYAPPATNAWCGLRNYISTNGSSIFFSSASVKGNPGMGNTGVWRFWEYHDGVLTNFANQSITGYSTSYEGHGNIISLGDDMVLVSSLRDDSDLGSWYLYKGSTLLEGYGGIGCHYTDNILVRDGASIVLGGEGRRLAHITLLTPGLNQKAKPDFSDLRFSVNGTDTLDYFLIHSVNASYATFGVNTTLTRGSFYAYVGNPSELSMSGLIKPYRYVQLVISGIEPNPHYKPAPDPPPPAPSPDPTPKPSLSDPSRNPNRLNPYAK